MTLHHVTHTVSLIHAHCLRPASPTDLTIRCIYDVISTDLSVVVFINFVRLSFPERPRRRLFPSGVASVDVLPPSSPLPTLVGL